MTDALSLAGSRVNTVCAELDLRDGTEARAATLAQRIDHEHPINRSADVGAAAAVYLAALLENDHVTQPAVATAAEVSTSALREAYVELAVCEGITLASEEDPAETDQSLLARLRALVSGGEPE